jgi:hypothetical protein
MDWMEFRIGVREIIYLILCLNFLVVGMLVNFLIKWPYGWEIDGFYFIFFLLLLQALYLPSMDYLLELRNEMVCCRASLGS